MTVVSITDGLPFRNQPSIQDLIVAFLETTGALPTGDIGMRFGIGIDSRGTLKLLHRMASEGRLASRREGVGAFQSLLWFVPGLERVSRTAPTFDGEDGDDDPSPTPRSAALRT